MMDFRRAAGIFAAAAVVFVGASVSAQTRGKVALVEEYVHEPMPPFVQVIRTEMDGPVFADAKGHTLYTWAAGGGAGEQAGKPTCDDTHYKVSAGLLGIYPPGLELPDVDTRPTCIQLWPAVYADDAAKPVGKWSVVARKDGKKQWAYDGHAVYTSSLDHEAGDVIGGSILHVTSGGYRGLLGATRTPIGPTPDIPAQFDIANTRNGRMLTLDGGFSVYTWDKDSANKSNCDTTCLRNWEPLLAAKTAPARGDWGFIERAPGVRQWTFRKKPIYAHIGEEQIRSQEGSDIPGWHNVYVQPAPPVPKGFTIQDTAGGQVLADSKGKTIYTYDCTDDALDAQACDHPTSPQIYRLAVCGGGDAAKCLAQFPYVIADKGAKSDSKIWSVVDIDPKTGHFAKPDQADALHVWAYRERPVYTFARDQPNGETIADSWGEHNGWRNGYHAYWLRAEFRKHD
jgi:predicted lipoprotein with Yx(FWY)xxD motif